MGGLSAWANTTHDWAATVDQEHLRLVRARARHDPPTVQHLVLETLAYTNDEAESLGRHGECLVTFHIDGSISVSDDGRGTDTRRDSAGRIVRKPVMATKDLRFFDHPAAAALPDGVARRGMSVVAALSDWLEHANFRADGAWVQRYEHGVPSSDLREMPTSSSTGTVVHFHPDPHLVTQATTNPAWYAAFRWITVRTLTE